MAGSDATQALEEAIAHYKDAWNAHGLDAIMAMHAPEMVFENHTAGESFEDGLVKRKDVYSDSVSILRQVNLLE